MMKMSCVRTKFWIMTNQEIAKRLGQIKGIEEHKLLNAGKQRLELPYRSIVKGFLTAQKEKLALPSGPTDFSNWTTKDSIKS